MQVGCSGVVFGRVWNGLKSRSGKLMQGEVRLAPEGSGVAGRDSQWFGLVRNGLKSRSGVERSGMVR